MDYRDLLKKYMRHVELMEGYTFVSDLSQSDFTVDEIIELEKIDSETE